jgi:hypothetical protein
MSSALDQQIRHSIDSFVARLHGLVREAAVQSVMNALGGRSTSAAIVRPRVEPAKSRAPRRQKGQKRDPKDLAALTARLGDYIARNPGKRIEDVAKALGTTTKELQLPARKLISARRVSTKGVKRATTYYPG